MRTTLGTIVRAAIMLACLIVVPLAAFLWDRLPEMFHTFLARLEPGASKSIRWTEEFVPAALSAAASDHPVQPAGRGEPKPAALGFESLLADAGAILHPAGDRGAESSQGAPRQRSAAAEPPGPAETGPRLRSPGAGGPPRHLWGAGGEAGGQASAGRGAVPHSAPLRAAPPGVAQGGQRQPMLEPARIQALEQFLQQRGALHYVLESWGPAGDVYRFECQMPLAPHLRASRRFEATDRDPLGAIERVVRDVEAWQSGRLR